MAAVIILATWVTARKAKWGMEDSIGDCRRHPRAEGTESLEAHFPNTMGDTRRPKIALAVPARVSQRNDLKGMHLILMLDTTRRCDHKDIWRPPPSVSSTDLFMRAMRMRACVCAFARSGATTAGVCGAGSMVHTS